MRMLESAKWYNTESTMWLRQLRRRKEFKCQFTRFACDNTCTLNSHIPCHPLKIVSGCLRFIWGVWQLDCTVTVCRVGGEHRVSAAVWQGESSTQISHKARGLRAQMGKNVPIRPSLHCLQGNANVYPAINIKPSPLPLIDTQVRGTEKREGQEVRRD